MKTNINSTQVLGCIMNNPLLLTHENVALRPGDFATPFHKMLFGLATNLFVDGAKEITPQSILALIEADEKMKGLFQQNDGLTTCQNMKFIAEEDQFFYYYGLLKRESLLRELKRDGFDISQFAPKMVKGEPVYQSVKEIIDTLKGKTAVYEDKFAFESDKTDSYAYEGLLALKERLKKFPEIGLGLMGDIFNTACRGARLKKYYVRSGGSGAGKTRTSVGDACLLAFPEFYHPIAKEWVYTGTPQKIAFFTTELESEEIQTLILAKLSGVNEEHIINGMYVGDEEERVDRAIEMVSNHKENFLIEYVEDPSTSLVSAKFRKHAINGGVKYFFYDYIHSSPALLSEFRDLRLREDVVLLLMSSTLKSLANELGVFVLAGTQINYTKEGSSGPKGFESIRGAKAINC